MANSSALVDTSIVIEHLRKHDKHSSILFRYITNHTLYLPTIVEFELFAGTTDEAKRHDVENILQVFSIVPLISKIAWQAAELYQDLKQRNQLIEIRDLLIAATAVVYTLPILTLNTKHFGRIPQLTILTD